MEIQWYPGHMTKARRAMQEDLKLIDVIVELVDARLPFSSKNPDIDPMANGKSRILLFNKSDLADPQATEQWIKYYQEQGYLAAKVNARSGAGIKNVNEMISLACREKTERDRRRGIKNRPVRAMIVGIPNVGKSTFINSFAKKACTRTGNKPGVTRGKQWIRLNKQVELLDTPGILWPKFDDKDVGLRLAFVGSIKDELYNMYELSVLLLRYLLKNYPGVTGEFYQFEEEGEPEEILEAIARRRGCVKTGGVPDLDKAGKCLVDDFRGGRIGSISLELPPPGQSLAEG